MIGGALLLHGGAVAPSVRNVGSCTGLAVMVAAAGGGAPAEAEHVLTHTVCPRTPSHFVLMRTISMCACTPCSCAAPTYGPYYWGEGAHGCCPGA